MSAPLTCTNLLPSGGSTIVTSVSNTFTWQSDGTQAAYYIEWGLNESGSTINNTNWIVDSISQHTFASSVFSNTLSYKWRVKIRNNLSQESPFSLWSVFIGGSPVSLSVIFPQNDMDVISSLPTYQHLFVPVGNQTQYSYQYLVYTGSATWDIIDSLSVATQESMTWDELELYGSSLVWDSGVVVSTATSVEQPSGYLLPEEYWYKVRVIITDNEGNQYTSDLRTFYIALNNVPQTPEITATSDQANGRNVISITNPTPDPGQVATSYNKLYRKTLSGTWELLQTNITSSTAYDTTCRSGVIESYSVSAVGTNLIEGGKSTSATATCTLTQHWFTNLTTNETIGLYLEVKWGQIQSERQRQENYPNDEKYPIVQYGKSRFYRGSFDAYIKLPIGSIWSAYETSIRDILDGDSPNTILMRSAFGDVIKMNIYDLTISYPDPTHQFHRLTFNFVEIEEMITPGTYTYDIYDSTLYGYWIIDPDTNTGYKIDANNEWNDKVIERDRIETIGIQAEMPTITYRNKNNIRSSYSGIIFKTDTTTALEEVMKLRELIDSKYKKPLLFRTASDEIFLVDIYGFSFEIYNAINDIRKVSFEFVELGGV